MDFAGIVNIALPVVYVLVGAVLVWLVVELALTIRSTRSTIDDAHNELTPTLKNVEKITAQVDPLVANVNTLVTEQVNPLLAKVNEIAEEAKPAVGRVDPLVERLSLTVDAANLELMRVDQILEDVTQITDSVSKAAGAVDTVTSAPIDLVNSLTGKLRNRFKPRYASDESVGLGAAADAAAASKAGKAPERQATVSDAVSAMGDAARAVIAEGKERRAAVKATNAANQQRSQDFEDQLADTAGTITNAAVANADTDTDEPHTPAHANAGIDPNAAAAQAKPAPVGNSPYTVE
ncbi:DUF948 domain-containing protein [Adlercreutzia sp. R25]|uniref:DUF948 domain-containing protein n=1 Tax=Adlercreutzia shanghongiae TaxID=3111773 RepID=UPI002DBA5910|nr:DUF948 domain-containing protein [Adlercreutzia sp. R25]MEC4273540.1 DUF948 domain-containing protein [Adlercreutzia sp. R25]